MNTNPTYLCPRRRGREKGDAPSGERGSWWIRLDRTQLREESERRFTVTPPSGVIVNTKGILDVD